MSASNQFHCWLKTHLYVICMTNIRVIDEESDEDVEEWERSIQDCDTLASCINTPTQSKDLKDVINGETNQLPIIH